MSTESTQIPLDKSRRRHDWPTIVAEFRASGMRKASFCRERGLNSSALYAALNTQQRLASLDKKEGFVKARIEAQPPPSVGTIDLPNGIKITFSGVDLGALIEQLVKLRR